VTGYIRKGEARYGTEPSPGKAQCECWNEKHGDAGCVRYGHMRDGYFLCRPCQRHAPQLKGEQEK
jgi:hypothetical protein